MSNNLLKNLHFVFCYHRVIPDKLAKIQMVHRALYVTPETFEKQIRWMHKHGRIVSLDNMSKYCGNTTFLITFDDGWNDNYIYAFPILKKYNVPAIIFIATDNIDRGKLFWSEELCIQIGISRKKKQKKDIVLILKETIASIMGQYDINILSFNTNSYDLYYLLDKIIECLKQVPASLRDDILFSLYDKLDVLPKVFNHNLLLNWDDILIMAKEGVSFGSHTHTHALLNRADKQTIEFELSQSKYILEKNLGRKIKCFSYPNGYFNNPYIRSGLLRYEYQYAFTLERLPINDNCDPFLIPRCLLFEDVSYSMNIHFLKLLIKFIISKCHS